MASPTCEPEVDALASVGREPGETEEAPVPADKGPNRWAVLVAQIRSGDNQGLEDLYEHFGKGVRFFLCRQLGHQELDDKVHDIFLIVVNAIMNGELRDPERLMGYIRTVVRRQAAVYIGATVQNRRGEVELEGEDSFADGRENPEESIMRDQQAALLKEMLEGISDRDREILTRFYLDEEPAAQICVSMGLSNTQFRLLKSRAKARFSAVTRRKFSEKGFYKKR